MRSFLIRGLAAVAVLMTYAASSVGTQVLTVAGMSSLALATTATPAAAQRWRRRRWRPWRRRSRRRRRW